MIGKSIIKTASNTGGRIPYVILSSQVLKKKSESVTCLNDSKGRRRDLAKPGKPCLLGTYGRDVRDGTNEGN